MRRDRISRATRALRAAVGGGFLILGIGELIEHVGEPLSLWLSLVLVILGAVLGLLASAWTVLMPVLALTLVVLTIVRASRQALVPADTNA